MREMFDKLEGYESRLSSSVWQGINQHLEAERKKRNQLRMLGAVVILLFLFSSIAGYYYFNTASDQMHDIVCVKTQDVAYNSSDVIHSWVMEDQQVSNEIYTDTDVSYLTTESPAVIKHVITSNTIIESSPPINDNSTISIRDIENRISIPFETVDEEEAILLSKNHQDIRTSESRLTQDLIEELTLLPGVPIGVKRTTIKSLFVKEGCDPLAVSPVLTYAWTQLSGFTPFSSHSARVNDFIDNAETRKQTETALPSVEFGFGLGIKTRGGVFAESGFQFARWRERLSYIDPESVGFQTVITIDTMFNSGGEIEVSADTTSVLVDGSREIVNFNTHTTVSVPLIVGYEKQVSPQMSIAIKAGTIFNLAVASEGRILDDQFNVIDINASEDETSRIYRDRFSMQLVAGGQFIYHFSPKMDVYLSPEFRVHTSSITSDSYQLGQKFISPTVGAGLKLYF